MHVAWVYKNNFYSSRSIEKFAIFSEYFDYSSGYETLSRINIIQEIRYSQSYQYRNTAPLIIQLR